MDFTSKWSIKQINCAFCAITTVLLIVAADVYGDSGTWHKRDQSDQIRPQGLPATHIVNLREGVRYLIQYGYLKDCIVSPRKKRSFFPDGPIEAGDSSVGESGALGKYCSPANINNALKHAQDTFHIEQSGQFDKATLDKMNSRRCGNSDTGITKDEKDKTVKTSDKPGSIEGKHSAKLHKRSLGDSLSPGSFDSYDFPRQAVQNSEKHSSLLLSILSKTNTYGIDDSLYLRGISERRKRYLHTYVNKVREDQAQRDNVDGSSMKSKTKRLTMEQLKDMVHIRAKRSNFVNGTASGVKFTKDEVRWRLLKTQYSHFIPGPVVEKSLRLSFRMWSEVSPLKFLEDTASDMNLVDIEIGFGRGSHMGCKHPFDGREGEVAHSWAGGDIHIDDDENYRFDEEDGLNLLKVVLHEIGHVLSLNHSNERKSIMYPIYTTDPQPGTLELPRTDRTKVQQIYGVCKGRFNTVFDILRRQGNRWLYYTYFFRQRLYWNYENKHERPRYGDPLQAVQEWNGFPNIVDAAVQVLYFNTSTKWLINVLYVFQGEHYYIYDINQEKMLPNYPRRISQDFGPKRGYGEGVPSNIDSVLFDWRNEKLYFIKGEWVWIYDVTAPSEIRGCEGKRRFVDVFPPERGSTRVLTGNIDAAYYSFKYDKVFFFKNESVWQNKEYSWKSRVHLDNKLKFDGSWYEKWHDICEV